MGLFDFLNRPDFNTLLEQAKGTAGAVILDVRTPEEFSQGHVPGAVNLPLDQIETIELDQNTPLFVYCHSGARSSSAAAILRNKGYLSVTNLGGIISYRGALASV